MSDLAHKLLIRPGQHVTIVHGPPASGWLGPLPDGVVVSERPDLAGDGDARADADITVLFAANQAELDALAPGLPIDPAAEPIIWIAYPKLTSRLAGDLSRDRLWQLMEPRGLVGVTQIAIDETWSALRFRPAANVGQPKKSGA